MAAGKPGIPKSLANDAAITASGKVGLTWAAPTSNGGSPILDYQIDAKTGTNAFSTIAASVSGTSYTALGLTPGAVYSFKVYARNAVGLGWGTLLPVSIRAAAKPNVPGAPTVIVNTDVSVTISWIAPSDGGSAITSYTVKIR